jgi:hypothetical protein
MSGGSISSFDDALGRSVKKTLTVPFVDTVATQFLGACPERSRRAERDFGY